MKTYATEQRQCLLSFLKAHRDSQYSVEELAMQLCGGRSISLSSIYRNINKMVAEGSVGRFTSDGSRKSLYQYIGGDDCGEHLHLKCEKCGRLFHVKDKSVESLITTAMDTSDFSIDKKKTVLYGSCKDCDV